MYIPTIPTDNLYKFLALGGLLLVVTSVLFPFYQQTELSLKKNEVEVAFEKLSLKVEALNSRNKSLLDSEMNHGPPPKDIDEKQKIRDREYKEQKVEVEGKKRALIIFKEDLEFYLHYKIIGITVGGFLSLIGFILWYFLVQRPIDIKLRALNVIDGEEST